MNIKQYEQHIYSLVLKECDLVSIIMLARTSKKLYDIVEYFLCYNKNFKQFSIPNDISGTNIHYLCEEFISKKCFRCGISLNLFYYKKNRNLKVCFGCVPICRAHISVLKKGGDLVCEKHIKGFTKRELRNRLFYKVNNHSPPCQKRFYVRDVEQITKNRYGFKTFTEYENFITRRFDRINTKTIRENDEKVGIYNNFLQHIKYKRGNSGYIFKLNEKEINSIREKIIRAKARYDYCVDILKHNEKIYDNILKLTENETTTRIYMRVKYNFKCIFDIKSIMFIEDFGYDGFFTDAVFKHFIKHNISVDKVVKKIISY